MRLSSRWVGCALWVMLLLGGFGCKRTIAGKIEPTPVWLGPLVIEPATGPQNQSAGLDRESLAQQARTQLAQAGIFAGEIAENSKVGAAVANVHIGLAMELISVEGKSALRAVVRLAVSTRPQGAAPAHFNEDVRANAEMLFESGAQVEEQAMRQQLAERTIRDLLATYIARQKLWSGDQKTLHAALMSSGDLRVEAIRATSARKLTDEVPNLIGLLSDDDEEVRDAALGALVELRDRRAVPALTKAKSMKDGREMRKIIDALATLGGQEALDYLSFVADAHEDEEVRKIAKSALQRLKTPAPKP